MSSPSLSDANKKQLRGLGHALRPVVMIATPALTDNLRNELETALSAHELIKVSVRVGDRQVRDGIIGEICTSMSASLVQRIGNMALLFRRNPEKPRIKLG